LVHEQTWWLVPEQLLMKTNSDGTQTATTIDLTTGTWTKDGEAFSAEDQRLFDLSTFFWKLHAEQTMIPYRWENVGKANMAGTAHVLQDFTKPDGHQLWTIGADLSESGIDLEGETSS
jgi:hypothetical protein